MESPYPRDEHARLSLFRQVITACGLVAATAPAFFFGSASFQAPPSTLAVLFFLLSLGWFAFCWCVVSLGLGRSSLAALAYMFGVAGFCVLAATARWPFQGRFEGALPTLNRLARETHSVSPTLSVEAGSFRIIKAEKRGTATTLWMENETAFVQSKSDPSGKFSLGECSHLSGNWWYVQED
jgi:hypothetical protein